MRWISVLLFLLLAIPAWGEEMSFAISGKQTAFVRISALHMTLSKDCEKSPGKFKCDAYSALAKASITGTYPKGGASPGAVICESKLGGQVMIGKDSGRNENAFCLFNDGSMVSCGSLAYFGRKNDLKRVE
jgi:hypothetical protein